MRSTPDQKIIFFQFSCDGMVWSFESTVKHRLDQFRQIIKLAPEGVFLLLSRFQFALFSCEFAWIQQKGYSHIELLNRSEYLFNPIRFNLFRFCIEVLRLECMVVNTKSRFVSDNWINWQSSLLDNCQCYCCKMPLRHLFGSINRTNASHSTFSLASIWIWIWICADNLSYQFLLFANFT